MKLVFKLVVGGIEELSAVSFILILFNVNINIKINIFRGIFLFLKIIVEGEISNWLINFLPIKSITIFYPSFTASFHSSPA